MNSIRRPRLRPRKRSSGFYVFAWLVTREAALRITYGRLPDGEAERLARRNIAHPTTDRVRAVCDMLLRTYPERRWFYGDAGRSPAAERPRDGAAAARAEP